ncbi:DUF2914 domain-containing protein [Methylomonas sp. DH-1]|uniref:DUF2914 domain-containing protein n=1 Tax=Methylomonas sp. (strain DH-1) TaxID=1727196 RepID=UPI0007C8C9D1|nr:DUF2914 domain-containing protein [Methylomonas sp. DH-1]ANE55831.1 hypothetical protein AYM39_11980 [Methylomonas sp. DH-1]
MADNRVVIKINYDKSKTATPATEPQTITVWHTGRIVIALVLLVLFSLFLYFAFSGGDRAGNTQTEMVEKVQEPQSNPMSAASNPQQVAAEGKDNNIKVDSAAVSPTPTLDNAKAGLQASSPVGIIFDRRVIRASLNTRLKDNEPDQPVQGAFAVVKGKPLELFYFTEIRNPGGLGLFHEWLRNKQVVQHKQLDLKDTRSKVWSSRVLSYKDVGDWQVRLSDKKGKVYSEVKFSLSAE